MDGSGIECLSVAYWLRLARVATSFGRVSAVFSWQRPSLCLLSPDRHRKQTHTWWNVGRCLFLKLTSASLRVAMLNDNSYIKSSWTTVGGGWQDGSTISRWQSCPNSWRAARRHWGILLRRHCCLFSLVVQGWSYKLAEVDSQGCSSSILRCSLSPEPADAASW